jgi:HD-GYP domain-containing protein (c-di-GMP phosphodiesterase class II)
MPGDEVKEIRRAGILHDIGKIGIPHLILYKPAHLTAEEYEIMKTHSVKGQMILEPLQADAMQRICHMVRHHHEMFDGRGYPDKLQGDQILLGARILAVADCFDTMVSDRAYRTARSYEEALVELRRCSGTQFDPKLVEAFLESLRIYGDPRRRPPLEEDDMPIEIVGARAFSRDAWHGMPLRAGRYLSLKLIASTLGMTTALPVPGNGCASPSSGSSGRRGRRWPGPNPV